MSTLINNTSFPYVTTFVFYINNLYSKCNNRSIDSKEYFNNNTKKRNKCYTYQKFN